MCYEECDEKKNQCCKDENKKNGFDYQECGENCQNPEVMPEVLERDSKNHESEWEMDLESDQRDDLACCKQLADIKEKYAHMTADFNNFRLRVEKEKMQWTANAQLDILKKLLPTIDMFDRAFQESAKSGIDE